MFLNDNGWVIYDRFPQLTHAISTLFRKSTLYCRVKFHKVSSLTAKGGGISEKLLKYWTCVKMPNLERYFMLFSLLFVVLPLLCDRHFGMLWIFFCLSFFQGSRACFLHYIMLLLLFWTSFRLWFVNFGAPKPRGGFP